MRFADVFVRPARGLARVVFVRPFTRLRGRPPGPAEKGVAGAVVLALLITAAVVAAPVIADDGCSRGLEEQKDECVGLVDATESAPVFKPGMDGPKKRFSSLVRKIADENRKVHRAWDPPAQDTPKKPYVRVALLLPFNVSESAAMTSTLLEHTLAGAYAAQHKANREETGVNFQLVLGNIGRDLSLWEPAVRRAVKLADVKRPEDGDAPLIGAMGLPNSDQDTEDAAEALSDKGVPSVSGLLSSPEIDAERLFKAAPDNRNYVAALARYLEKEPGRKQGYLVWDSRAEDNYVTNTKAELKKRFGKKYELDNRHASYKGSMGPYQGATHAMAPAAEGICKTESDTVFVAGRDWDLPYLVKAIAEEPECHGREQDDTIRILRVATGLTSRLTTGKSTELLEEANVVTLNAAAVDAPSWAAGQDAPGQFGKFKDTVDEVADLDGHALDDGYALMHYDAFQVLSEAVAEAKESVGERRLPSKHEVTDAISNMRMLPDDICQNCVPGASGEFGYTAGNGNWPVCKPVPVVRFPRPEGYEPPKPYRTSQGENGVCPE